MQDHIDFINQSRTSRAQHECSRSTGERIKEKDEQMNRSVNQGSAKIYQFPVGGRAAANRQDEIRSSKDQAIRPVNAAVCSDSWYHEAAIAESKRER
jgi:hypothetical protein